jgi:hypothetical protein
MSRPLFRFADLYLVKMIGDEFWWVYEVDDSRDDVMTSVASAFFSTILDLFAGDRYLALHPMAPAVRDASGGRSPLPVRQFNLPLKAFVDFIGEATEVNVARYEYLKDVIAMAEGGPSTVYRVDRRFIELCDRLNLGAATALGKSARVTTRTDFIGLEIDRFFRLTRFGKPSLLGVGESLMTRLPCVFSRPADVPEGVDIGVVEIPSPWTDGEPMEAFKKYAITEHIPSPNLKGVSGDYSICHVFGAASLGDSIYAQPAAVETLMTPTRAFLAERGFFALRREKLLA